ncbi:MAG: hypothetical protein LBV40_02510 [Methanomicrobiales archaeon]|jgi:predicted transcriptional regulator|nr:hypothetical protein [Methanomicrobiales archaeon]
MGSVLKDSPDELWKKVEGESGIDYQTFCNYFKEKKEAYAIQINDLRILDEPIDPKERNPGFVAPQSYRYLKKGEYST